MTPPNVQTNNMYDSLDCDDATAEALLAGAGQDVDPALARVLDLVRLSYAATPPIVGAELGALIRRDAAAPILDES